MDKEVKAHRVLLDKASCDLHMIVDRLETLHEAISDIIIDTKKTLSAGVLKRLELVVSDVESTHDWVQGVQEKLGYMCDDMDIWMERQEKKGRK